ncbi:MAG: PD-(D/E)XK nuclease family protein [Paludibacteraceae bacterium]|nr:PD-(D/E)XK nuclease family protein [Paludibacteraceae bacterium]
METTENQRPTIVLNRMFAGKYLSNHIGHEIINMFKSDNGHNYIYIQPYGTYDAIHFGEIGYVMLVRGLEGKRALEVLGIATDLKDIYDPKNTDIYDPKNTKQWKFTQELIKKQEITYGGVHLDKIFVHKVGDKDAQSVYITFEAGKVMRPNKPLYLVYGEKDTICDSNAKVILLPNTGQAKSSLKQYFTSDNEDYKKLLDLINEKDLWTVETTKVNTEKSLDMKKEDNFFDICGVDDYELAFSNAFAYFMDKYPELVVEFAKEVLAKENIKVTDKPFYIIEREVNNVDILLENDEKVVVIENKVTSKINGVKVVDNKTIGTQLDKYYRYALERANGEDKENKGKGQVKRKQNKEVACYILTPNYNPIDLSSYFIPGFNPVNHYKQIFYKQVYDFLKNKHPEDWYFQEFIKGLEKHTKEHHNDLFEDTMQKFVKQIKVKSNEDKQGSTPEIGG